MLVVEDDVYNIEVIENKLNNEYTIAAAHNGKEAIEMLAAFMPDFILLDWNMPVMNGLDTLRFLKANTQTTNIPVVMMTGYMTEMDDMMLAYENGVIDFIRKPFDLMELKARLRSIHQFAKYYKQELLKKDHELVALTSKLALVSESLNETITKIDTIDSGNLNVESLITIIKDKLRNALSETIWVQFDEQFRKVRPEFLKNFINTQPDLTPAEIKLASLLCLNLNTKEIAGILSQTYDSVRVSRTRLRKKLNLETEDGLVAYLLKF